MKCTFKLYASKSYEIVTLPDWLDIVYGLHQTEVHTVDQRWMLHQEALKAIQLLTQGTFLEHHLTMGKCFHCKVTR